MMLKEAIEKIEEMSRPKVYAEDGHSYVLYADHTEELRPAIDSPETVRLSSLDALVQLVKKEQRECQIFVSVIGHDEVAVYDSPSEDSRRKRNFLYNARAVDIPGWEPEV